MKAASATPPSPAGRSKQVSVQIALMRTPPTLIAPRPPLPDDPESERAPDRSFDASAPRPPLGEAHGGYTFCATASLVLLQPYVALFCSAPSPPKVDARALLRWCVQMQGAEIELGGFKGRTNKLVDGCYSWWVGGCVVLAETLLGVAAHADAPAPAHAEGAEHDQDGEKAWEDVDGAWGAAWRARRLCGFCAHAVRLGRQIRSSIGARCRSTCSVPGSTRRAGCATSRPSAYAPRALRAPLTCGDCTFPSPRQASRFVSHPVLLRRPCCRPAPRHPIRGTQERRKCGVEGCRGRCERRSASPAPPFSSPFLT